MAATEATRDGAPLADGRWYALDPTDVVGELAVVVDSGLSADEAAARLTFCLTGWRWPAGTGHSTSRATQDHQDQLTGSAPTRRLHRGRPVSTASPSHSYHRARWR
jgi:hypothetical protein